MNLKILPGGSPRRYTSWQCMRMTEDEEIPQILKSFSVVFLAGRQSSVPC